MEPRQELVDCERFFLGIKSIEGTAVRYKGFPVRCNSWNCRTCARIKADKYRERMRPLFENGTLFFYTFTFYHGRPPMDVWADVSKAWNRLRTAAAKKYGSFSYARVLEHHHHSPYPHLHVIADIEFKPTWLGPELKRAGFGYQSICKPVTSEGAATYVTKYLTKPWTDEACKNIRKNLKLRIISFGGDACTPLPHGSVWTVIGRATICNKLIDKILLDLEWTHGCRAEKTYESVVDASVEFTYQFPEGGFTSAQIHDELDSICDLPFLYLSRL